MSANHERRLRALEAAVSNLARAIAEIRTEMKDPVAEAVHASVAAQVLSGDETPRRRGRPPKAKPDA